MSDRDTHPGQQLVDDIRSAVAAAYCIVPGCRNEVVRKYRHKQDRGVAFGVCQFHGQVIVKYGTAEQVRDYLFDGVTPK